MTRRSTDDCMPPPMSTNGPAQSHLARPRRYVPRRALRPGLLPCCFWALVIAAGLVKGDYFDYEGSQWLMLPGKAAGVVGMAAEDITIAGLSHHDPEALLGGHRRCAGRFAHRV